jgi:5-methylcytosine-specific restriction endonuclease McrA
MPTGKYDRKASVAAMSHLKKFWFKPDHIVPEEMKLRWSEDRKAEGNPMFGRTRTEEEKQLMSLHRKGLTVGERNPNWRGGISTVAHLIRTSPEYKKWRQAILERDNYTCQNCNKRGGDLNVDHFPKTFKEILDEFSIKSIEDAMACEALWDTESNRTLCVTCHRGGGLYGEIA